MANQRKKGVMDNRRELLKKLEKQEIKRQERMLLGMGAIIALGFIVRFCLYGYL